MVAAAPTSNIVVMEDEVVLYGSGRYQIMKRSEFHEKFSDYYFNQSSVPAQIDTRGITTYTSEQIEEIVVRETSNKIKRDNGDVVIMGQKTRFLGWDVQISPIVKGGPNTGTFVAVAAGYSISNSIAIGVSAKLGLIEKVLSVSASFLRTWTTTNTQDQTLSFFVPPGKIACWVSNPWTNRQEGWVWTGTIGQQGSLEYWRADQFESKQYNNLAWVDGVMQTCVGDDYPLKRCSGAGFLGAS